MKYYKFALVKSYFDKGYAITSPVKLLIALFGIASLDVEKTLLLGIIYIACCFVVGYIWYNRGIVEAEQEVDNKHNLFVKQMRELSGSSLHRKA